MSFRQTLRIIGVLLLLLRTCTGFTQIPAQIKAAAGKIEITPKTSVYLAGYGIGRKSTGVHDPLSARCLILEVNGKRVAFVSCDLIGIFHRDVEEIRRQIKTLTPDHVMISATHTHSGPDTLGQWGPNLAVSGVDEVWFTETKHEIAALVDRLSTKLEMATLTCGVSGDAPPISKNIRVPRILDREVGVLQINGTSGNSIATLVNFACHPEILDTRQITADFPAALYRTVETKTGGVCLYLNGAQGGMITADFDETETPRGQNWKAAEKLGSDLGNFVLNFLPQLKPLTPKTLTLQHKLFTVPMENPRFIALTKLKVFPPELIKNGEIETEVNRITLGDCELLTLPGEALPNIGLYLKTKMHGKFKFLLGLTNDELGYILTPEDFVLDLYKYEASVSVGEQMSPRMIENLLSLLTSQTSQGKKTLSP